MDQTRTTTTHVLLLAYPTQGHINPLLHFAHQLATGHAFRSTLAVTRFIARSTSPSTEPVHIATISDGCDDSGYLQVGDVPSYLARLEQAGSESLHQLFLSESQKNRPVHVLVYDPFLPWAADVARRNGIVTAAFFSQPCAVNAVYGHVWTGRLKIPVQKDDEPVRLAGLVTELEPDAVPTFLVGSGVSNPYLESVINQFKGLELADHVLINSFYELQPQEADHIASTWRGKTIGPTLPLSFLGSENHPSPDTAAYGLDLVSQTTAPYKAWLDSHTPHSVIFISFGSLNDLDKTQISELAYGLLNTNNPFLWVVRPTEAHKLPKEVVDNEKDCLVVSWCPQLEVLAHEAVGCFLTHCGWNSTLEAISLGVPLVAMPQWADQTTNAKYVESVWKVGVRVTVDGKEGVVKREEVERCLREVMDGERSGEYKKNALRWKEMANLAVKEGGSSNRNIAEFVAKYK